MFLDTNGIRDSSYEVLRTGTSLTPSLCGFVALWLSSRPLWEFSGFLLFIRVKKIPTTDGPMCHTTTWAQSWCCAFLLCFRGASRPIAVRETQFILSILPWSTGPTTLVDHSFIIYAIFYDKHTSNSSLAHHCYTFNVGWLLCRAPLLPFIMPILKSVRKCPGGQYYGTTRSTDYYDCNTCPAVRYSRFSME